MLLPDLLQPLGVPDTCHHLADLISFPSGVERLPDPGSNGDSGYCWGTGSKEAGTCGDRKYHLKGCNSQHSLRNLSGTGRNTSRRLQRKKMGRNSPTQPEGAQEQSTVAEEPRDPPWLVGSSAAPCWSPAGGQQACWRMLRRTLGLRSFGQGCIEVALGCLLEISSAAISSRDNFFQKAQP